MNYRSKLLLSAIIILTGVFSNKLKSQSHKNVVINFEAGTNPIANNVPDMDFIRASQTPYYENNSSDGLNARVIRNFIGSNIEFRSKDHKSSISFGVRLSNINLSLDKDSNSGGSSSYFYLRYYKDETNTYFTKIKKVKQNSYYVSLPVEIKRYILDPSSVRLYAKLGTELGYMFDDKTDIKFVDSSMDTKKDDVAVLFDSPKNIYSSIYGGGGITFGQKYGIKGYAELLVTGNFDNKSLKTVETMAGVMFKFGVEIPLFSINNKKKSSIK